jgi:hypothetical protein
MSPSTRYMVAKDDTGSIRDLIRFVDDGKGLWAERYTEGQWVPTPGLTRYLFEPPLDAIMISEAEAGVILKEEGHLL